MSLRRKQIAVPGRQLFLDRNRWRVAAAHRWPGTRPGLDSRRAAVGWDTERPRTHGAQKQQDGERGRVRRERGEKGEEGEEGDVAGWIAVLQWPSSAVTFVMPASRAHSFAQDIVSTAPGRWDRRSGLSQSSPASLSTLSPFPHGREAGPRFPLAQSRYAIVLHPLLGNRWPPNLLLIICCMILVVPRTRNSTNARNPGEC